jgi:hypothetical protein
VGAAKGRMMTDMRPRRVRFRATARHLSMATFLVLGEILGLLSRENVTGGRHSRFPSTGDTASSVPIYGKPRNARNSRHCKRQCSIWVQGSLGGEYVRRSLDLTNWQAAEDVVRSWEVSGRIGHLPGSVL